MNCLVNDCFRTLRISRHVLYKARRQAGVVLFAALIGLVAMTLAAIALFRSIDTGLIIAGNTAFKDAATAAADVAIDAATAWIQTNSAPATTLHAPAASGYYANWMAGCDMTGNKTLSDKNDNVDWEASGGGCGVKAVSVGGMPSGFAASYVITRMCSCDGAPAAVCAAGEYAGKYNICSGTAGSGRFHGTADYVYRGLQADEASRVATGSPYYRVVTRVVGPRNTTSFVETVITLE